MIMRETEAEFASWVTDLARACGWLVYSVPDSRRTEPGYPDKTMVHPEWGLIRFVECKTDEGRVSTKRRVTKRGRVLPSQQDWIDALGADVWRPRMRPWIEAFLKGEPAPGVRPLATLTGGQVIEGSPYD